MDEVVDKAVCDVKMCTLKDILVNQESKFENHENRIKTLEDYNIQAKISSESMQKQQFEQKALTLELDAKQRENTAKEFAKVDKQFEKTEASTEKQLDKLAQVNKNQFDSQNVLLLKLVEGQNITKTGKIEISKSMVAALVIFLGIIEVLIQKFL